MSGNNADFVDRLYGPSMATAIKPPVRVATTANIASMSGELTIDGIALAQGDRVLVKNQSTSSQNGIYIVQDTAWTQAPDWDGSRDAMDGTLVFVAHGSTNGGHLYYAVCSAETNINIGTDSVTFTRLV